MRRLVSALTGAATMTLLFALPVPASAQLENEPIRIAYDAPPTCPGSDAFFGEITARTTRARAAQPGESARVLHVSVVSESGSFVGRLLIEDTAGRSTPRQVRGATCLEVVEALGLVSALALDPKASTAPRASHAAAEPVASSAPETSVERPTPSTDASSTDAPTKETAAARPTRGPPRAEVASAAERGAPPRAHTTHLSVGAGVEGAAVAGMVASGRLFGDLELGDRARGVLVPSVRLSVGRSLDVDRAASVGAATLRWTTGALEGCPLRLSLVRTLAVRPCAGIVAGVIDAEGRGVGSAVSRTRPWTSAFAHGRLVWEPWTVLGIELEVGAIMPFFRETFFFRPAIAIYEAPVLAFLGRAGIAVHFP